MKTLLSIAIFLASAVTVAAQQKTFFDFKTTDIDGNTFDLSSLKGKKVLVVNTASRCGNTPQYAQLEEMFKEYGGPGFTIIAFPANNFLSQEPGTNAEIKSFCARTYNVTFPIMSKISVKGKDIDPIYQWLTTKEENGVMDAPVKWNFQKFMIDENGHLVGVVAPGESPMCDKILNWIKGKN